MRIHALWLSASALALIEGGAAYAADKPIPEVVVTAERRTENLQNTAIAATVVTGTELSKLGVTTVDQLQFIAPAAVINNFGQGIDFNVRGIGKAEHNTQTTTGVITYRDGVPTFPGYLTEEPYYDIASIEILRGPQGTFVGQNATGGAVFVNTQNPVINGGHHGYIQGQAGEHADFGVQGAINLPISDTLAARIAVFSEIRDSFYDIKGPGGAPYTSNPGRQRWGAGRISYLWRPTERLSFLWKTDLAYLDNGAYPADPVNSPNDLFKITANAPMLAKDKLVRTSMKIDYVLPSGLTFRSVSAYQHGDTSYTTDLDGTAIRGNTFFDKVAERIISEEFNIISPSTGVITWVLGAFAQHDEYDFKKPYQFVVGNPPGFVASEYKLQGTNPKTAVAGFGQVSLNLPAGLQAQFGGRYSWAKTTNHVQIIQFGLPLVDEQEAEYSAFSYKAALNWKLSDSNFLYAFIATGHRPGGLNVPVGLGLPAPFDQEKVTEYEVGWKTAVLGGRIRAQFDAFYNRYNNFQVIIGYPTIPVFGIELNNPNETRIYGFEAQVQAVFGDFSLQAGLAGMNSLLGQFFATDPRAAAFAPCNPMTGPASASCINLKGRRQTYAPNFTFNLSAQYDFHLGNGDTITPRLNFGHVSPQWATLFENVARGDRIEERNILGGQVAWTHGSLTASVYGTNLTNQHYVGAINSGLRFAGPPRQVGFRLLKLF